MRGRSWASSGLVSWSSEVERLMQEQRSRELKKAEATWVPSQLATPLIFSGKSEKEKRRRPDPSNIPTKSKADSSDRFSALFLSLFVVPCR
ncbi:hypothetical protein PS2_002163 [Malus domestica]